MAPQSSGAWLTSDRQGPITLARRGFGALVEAHNGQVAAGVRGWAQRDFMNRREPLDRNADVDPPVAQALNLRLVQEGVMPIREAAAMWKRIDALVGNLTPAQQSTLHLRSRMDSGSQRRAEVRRLGVETAVAANSNRLAASVARSAGVSNDAHRSER